MDLILWRHAEAEDYGTGLPEAAHQTDLQRELTGHGRKQARIVADWLRKHLPTDATILVSPAARAQQTAAALDLPFTTHPKLAPGRPVADLLSASGWPDHAGTCLLVGHQPTLGRLAARLLCDEEAYWSVKKSAVWWFSSRTREGNTQTVLRAVVAPEWLADI